MGSGLFDTIRVLPILRRSPLQHLSFFGTSSYVWSISRKTYVVSTADDVVVEATIHNGWACA